MSQAYVEQAAGENAVFSMTIKNN